MHNYNKLHYIGLIFFVLTHILGVYTLTIHLKYIVAQKMRTRYPIFFIRRWPTVPVDVSNPGGDCQV
jgi:hypothetical protein